MAILLRGEHPMGRRTLLKGAGAGGFVAVAASRQHIAAAGNAQTAGLCGDGEGALWGAEYWARKSSPSGEISLNLWRKRIGAPDPAEPSRPVLFLVHGSSNSARPSFDLAVDGKGEYSLMNVFARYGYDVWTMDHDGYGHSGSSGNNSDIASSVVDLTAALPVLARETGRSKFHFFGASSGAIRAAAFAQAEPERVERLVLVALTYKGSRSPTLRDRSKQVEYYRTHNRRPRDRAMIRSIFTRDNLAASYDMAVIDAFADAELKFGEEVPTGTYLDMTANLPLVDPTRIVCPVAIVHGDHDGIATPDDLFDFYQQLPNGDRVFITLPNTAHNVAFASNRHLLWYATRSFLAAPAPA